MSRNTLELTYNCNLKISQVEAAIRNVINAAKKHIPNINLSFEFGPITNREGVSYGKGFLFLKDNRIVHLLEGKDVDGHDRYIEVEVGGDEIDEAESADVVLTDNAPFRPSFTGSWGDYEDEETTTTKKVKRQVAPPLIEFEELVCDEETYTIEFSRITDLENVPESKSLSVLKCYKLRNRSIDVNFIKNKLSIFSTDSKYPLVTLRKDTLYVVFGPRSDDASFCKLVRHKLQLDDGHCLIFSYADSDEADIVRKYLEQNDSQKKKVPRPGTAPKQPAIKRTKDKATGIALSKSTGNLFDVLGDTNY